MQLNLFATKRDFDRNLLLKRDELDTLLDTVIASHKRKYELARTFNYKFYPDALRDWDAFITTLDAIEALIPSKLVVLDDVEHTEETLIKAVEAITANDYRRRIINLGYTAAHTWDEQWIKGLTREKALRELIHTLYQFLQTQLQIIARIRKLDTSERGQGPKLRDLVLSLFDTIIREEEVFAVLEKNKHSNENTWKTIRHMVLDILTYQEIDKSMEPVIDAFVERAVRLMGKTQSRGKYRFVAEEVFEYAISHVIQTKQPKDAGYAMEEIDQFLQNEDTVLTLIQNIIRTKKLQFDANDIPRLVLAFKRARNSGHFEGLTEDLYKRVERGE